MRSGRRYTHVSANNSKKTWTGRPSTTSSTHATPMGRSASASSCARTKHSRRKHQHLRGGAGLRKKHDLERPNQQAACAKSLQRVQEHGQAKGLQPTTTEPEACGGRLVCC